MGDRLSDKNFTFNEVFKNFVISGTVFLLILYAKFHWGRRHIYKIAATRKGPTPILPILGHGWRFFGSNEKVLKEMSNMLRNYRSPMALWLGPKLHFLIHEPKHMEIVMNSPYALAKSDVYKFTIIGVGYGLFTAPVPKWKRHRKIIMPTFNQKILDSFVEIFAEQGVILTQQLAKQSGQGTFDVFHYVSNCTLDSICETAMGIQINAQTTDAEFVTWANRSMEIAYNRIFSVYLHIDFIFNLTQGSKELTAYTTKMKKFTEKVVKQKRQEYRTRIEENKDKPEAQLDEGKVKRKTFLEQLIELSEAGANFTDDDLRDEVITMLVAGSETTASVVSFVFMMLGMHPAIQEIAYNEVIENIGYDKLIECSDLHNLSYIELVIKETMRIFPVGPILVRATNENIDLGDFMIPKDCAVVFGIIETHRNPKTWPNPLVFNPLRFLPEECAKRHPYSYLPFSGGPRNCIGFRYAYLAMKSIIATVLRKYKISTPYTSPEDVRIKADMVLKPVCGYNISLELRESI